jgi:hypothetical protein
LALDVAEPDWLRATTSATAAATTTAATTSQWRGDIERSRVVGTSRVATGAEGLTPSPHDANWSSPSAIPNVSAAAERLDHRG